MIHSIVETIPPGPNIFQTQIDPHPVSSLPENLNPEVEQPEVVHTLVTPQISVATETPISHSQPYEIYFGPDGEVLPPGLIMIEEILKDDTHLTPTILGGSFICMSLFLNHFHLHLLILFPFNLPLILESIHLFIQPCLNQNLQLGLLFKLQIGRAHV